MRKEDAFSLRKHMNLSYDHYENHFVLCTGHCDFFGKWKPYSILENMQIVASEHCMALGIGQKNLAERGLSWVLFKLNVQISAYPTIGEEVSILTYTKSSRFNFFPRYYIAKKMDGEILCKAGSLWMMIDQKTRQSISPKKSGIELPACIAFEAATNVFSSCKMVSGETFISEYNPQYSDLDINGHVNNTKCIEWLCNRLGIDFMKEKELSCFDIEYIHEIQPQMHVEQTLNINNSAFFFSGASQGNCLFRISGEMRERK